MHTLTYDETSVTLNTGFIQSRRIHGSKMVAARLSQLNVETMPPLLARRVFENVCHFYATRKRLDLVLTNGQQVRHLVRYDGMSSTRIATFQDGLLLWNNIPFKSLSAFAQKHYRDIHPKRTTANGWNECQALVGDKW
jgi:transposase-like protein